MKKFLIAIVLIVSIVGCRAAVPLSFAAKMKTHNKNVQFLHAMLDDYLEAEIAAVESKLIHVDKCQLRCSDKALLLLKRAHLKNRLSMVYEDKQLSIWLEEWATKHQWKLAVSANE